jgi:hypothetical protein
MNSNRDNGQTAILTEKYFEGRTSAKEEQSLFAYFSTENVSADLQEDQLYFSSFNRLKNRQILLSLSDEKPKKRYSLAPFARYASLAAASAALLAVLFYFQTKPKAYVVIDGKKYTDKEMMEEVFLASLQNVKQNTQELFNDMDDVIQW